MIARKAKQKYTNKQKPMKQKEDIKEAQGYVLIPCECHRMRWFLGVMHSIFAWQAKTDRPQRWISTAF